MSQSLLSDRSLSRISLASSSIERPLWAARALSAVQSSLVPSCAPATEYVAMPDGSSSAAPVITPGPSDFNSNRIHRDGANVGTKESECVPLPSRTGSSLRITARESTHNPGTCAANRALKVVQCDQTSPVATSMMLCSEEVRQPLQRPVSFL